MTVGRLSKLRYQKIGELIWIGGLLSLYLRMKKVCQKLLIMMAICFIRGRSKSRLLTRSSNIKDKIKKEMKNWIQGHILEKIIGVKKNQKGGLEADQDQMINDTEGIGRDLDQMKEVIEEIEELHPEIGQDQEID
jgi:hypothetical protein